MPVVTRSQKKLISIDVESKDNQVQEVPLDKWFVKTILAYLDELSELNKVNANYEDKLRVVTEMYYTINEHFEYGVAKLISNKSQVELINLALRMYIKTDGMINSIKLLKKSQVPNKFKKLALDELTQAKQMLHPYVAFASHVVKDFTAENEVYNIYDEDEDEEEDEEEDKKCVRPNKHIRFIYSDDE